MLFRFVTWTLAASIIVCIVGAYQAGPVYPSGDVTIFSNLLPFEKFMEGDVVEPLLLGQYSITERVSPFIPINPLTESLLNVQNSYQTPAKPLPANFNVYKAPNPAPVQYKPAPLVNYAAPIPTPIPLALPPLSYAHAPGVPSYLGARHGYAPAYPPRPVYSSPHALPSYLPQKPDIIYGLNYEQNQQQIFVPTASYPNSAFYYQPLISSQVFKSSAPPAIHNQEKPIASKATAEIEKVIETKKDDAPADSKSSSTPVQNDSPTAKTVALPASAPQTSTAALPAPSTAQSSSPQASLPTKSPPALPAAPETAAAALLGQSTKPIGRLTGYRWLSRRGSNPTVQNQEQTKNYQTAYAYRSLSPYVQSYSNPNYSLQGYANTTADYNKRSGVQSQQRPASREATKSLPVPSNSNNRNLPNLPNFNTPLNQKFFNPQASAANFQQTSVYNENNVAEIVLRGYSVNQEDNNNKAIIRVFEEGSGALYFDMKFCNLKKDRIYSIYVHDHGQINAGCESAGGLYGAKETFLNNPMLGVKSNPRGFLGSVKSNGEPVNVQHFAKNLLLRDLLGRSIVIHEITPDPKVIPEALESQMINNFSMLMNPLSSPSVTSKKVACGIIGKANPFTFLRPANPQCEIEVAVVEPKAVQEEIRKRNPKEDELDKSVLKREQSAGQTSSLDQI